MVAVELFLEVETVTHRMGEIMKKEPQFYSIPGWFEYVSALHAPLLVKATTNLFHAEFGKSDETFAERFDQEPALSLEYLVSSYLSSV